MLSISINVQGVTGILFFFSLHPIPRLVIAARNLEISQRTEIVQKTLEFIKENKKVKTRKHAIDRESGQEKKKKKHVLDQEND